jgi:hypothetical protein
MSQIYFYRERIFYCLSQNQSEVQNCLLGCKDKAVPPHAMEALGGRGGIAPTHSRPRHGMGVSGQPHAPAAVYCREMAHGWASWHGHRDYRKNSLPVPGIEPLSPSLWSDAILTELAQLHINKYI